MDDKTGKNEHRCPFCMKKVTIKDFRDKAGRQEFERTGICQECQDSMSGSNNDMRD